MVFGAAQFQRSNSGSYIGAQAAEMALLLRRVRAAFGVGPEDVRLMATSATISDGADTKDKLSSFLGDLAVVMPDRTKVIQGHTTDPILPAEGADQPLDPVVLGDLDSEALWHMLAPHPRIRRARHRLSEGGLSLGKLAEILFGADAENERDRAQAVLDAAAQARCPETDQRLLPWRAHLFHRAQGGLWACIDPDCPHRDAELERPESGWGFGALHLAQRDHCFDEDAMRREVATRLMPAAQIEIRAKVDVPHERRLTLYLEDGRRIVVLLDQGFGAWRATGVTRHDFTTAPASQAEKIRGLSCAITTDPGRNAPAIVYDDSHT